MYIYKAVFCRFTQVYHCRFNSASYIIDKRPLCVLANLFISLLLGSQASRCSYTCAVTTPLNTEYCGGYMENSIFNAVTCMLPIFA